MDIYARFRVTGLPGSTCDRKIAFSWASGVRHAPRAIFAVSVEVTGYLGGDVTGDTASVTWYADGGAEAIMQEAGERTVCETFESRDADQNFRDALRVAHGFVIAG